MSLREYSKEKLEEMYPQGTVLRLLERIDDPFTPKEVGDLFTVKYADDNLQLHGSWGNGGSIALIVGKDKFEKVD